MSTTTIGSMTLGTAANLTGAAKMEFEDSGGTSVYFTAATLRTQMFAGGTGYTAADPLTVGAITSTIGTFTINQNATTTVSVNNSNTVSSASRAEFRCISGTVSVGFTAINGLGGFIGTADATDLVFVTGGTSRLTVSGTTGTVTATSTVITVASATGSAGLRLPHGAAPTSPTNGDMWTTTAGAFIRINGVTKTFTLT